MVVSFSRLLKVFKLNSKPAYIVELNKNNRSILFLSYNKTEYGKRVFVSKMDCTKREKEYFNGLSNKCLFKKCKDTSYMFQNSPITHFEMDYSVVENAEKMFENSKIINFNCDLKGLVYAYKMFYRSHLKCFNGSLPNVIVACKMFSEIKAKNITIKFERLSVGNYLFQGSDIENLSVNFPNNFYSYFVFSYSKIKNFKCNILSEKLKMDMQKNFKNLKEFKIDNPYLFV